MSTPKPRIWEIDAVRGVMILAVVVLHSLYFGANMLGLFRLPRWLQVFMAYAGALFVVLSGLSATLGSRSFRRGLLVFAGGMVITLGSWIGVKLGFLTEGYVVRFGILHLLGVCMMLYPLLKRLPVWLLAVLAAALIPLGYWLNGQTVSTHLLFPLGLVYPGFASGDYFPLLPHLGWFCLGIVLGRALYAEKKTRLPGVNAEAAFWRFLRFCGRHSLIIFVLHLPIVGGIMTLIALLR